MPFLYGCNVWEICYHLLRDMARTSSEKPGIQLTIATAEVKKKKAEGPLFYILPPLVVAAVFIYCNQSTPHMVPPPPPPVQLPEEPMSEEEAEFYADQDEPAPSGSQQKGE